MKETSKSGRVFQTSMIILACSGVYANTLFNSFVYDDIFQILNNPWIRDPGSIVEIFSSGAWGFNATETNYYRPVMHIIYMFTYALFQLKPWGFHLVNIVFHSVISILVFFITSEILRKTRYDLTGPRAFIPFLTAIIFSLHPIHTEAVAWIGGIPDLSFSFFFLLSFYLYILSEQQERPWRPYLLGASIGSFFIATLCKEPAVMLVLIILIYDLIFNRSRMRVSFCAKRHLFYLFILIIYFVLRLTVLGGFSPVNKHADLTLVQAFLNIFPLFAKYMYLLLVPINLTVWHAFHPIQHASDIQFLLAVGFALSFFLFGLYTFRANKIIFFSLCLLTVPLLPALYIPGTGENPFAERYLYLPSFGFALLVSLLMAEMSSFMSHGKIIVSCLLLVICTFYSAATFSRNFDWKDELTFWTDTVRKSPDEPLPHFNLGTALEREGRLDEAIEQYQKAIALKPASVAYKALGSVYYRMGLKSESALEYENALEHDPENAELLNEAGIVFMETGHYKKALYYFMKAVRLVPDNPRLRYNLALALGKTASISEAIVQLKIAVKLDPSQTAFRNALKKLSKDEK